MKEYPKNLEFLAQQRYLGSFLDPGSKNMLIEKAHSLAHFLKSKRRRPLAWGITIPKERPLRFTKCMIDGMSLQVDVAFRMEGVENDLIEIKKQSMLVRVWSWDEKVSYREGIDAHDLRSKLEQKGWNRVILRFHFDLREGDAKCPEPLFHMQVGGVPEDSENCWIPKKIRVPRFPYPPLDVVLLSEFILMNFFHKESESLRKKPEWTSLVRKSQEMFLKPYVIRYMSYINAEDDTLLGKLVS